MRQVGRLRGVAARARRARDAARPARADAPRRRAAWLVALVLAIMASPGIAKAEVIKTPSAGTVEGFVHYVAYPYDTADEAAMATLGYEWSTFSAYRQAQISQLAAWRAYADKFHNVASDFSAIGVYEWILQYVGGDQVWVVNTGQEFYDQAAKVARAAIQVDGGDGFDSDTGDGTYPGTVLPKVASFTGKVVNSKVTNNQIIPASCCMRFSDEMINYITNNVVTSGYKYRTIVMNLTYSSRFSFTMYVVYSENKPEFYLTSNGYLAVRLDGNVKRFTSNQYTSRTFNTLVPSVRDINGLVSVDVSINNSQCNMSTGNGWNGNLAFDTYQEALLYWTSPNITSIGPDEPNPPVTKPTQPEPQDPVAPSPPQLPDPIETPVPDPPDPIETPTYNPDPTGTNQDYTPWLDEIIRLLRMINTSIVTLTNEMIGAVNTAYDAVVDSIYSHQMEMRQLVTWLNTQLQEGMDGAIEQLNDFLYHTMGWFEDDLQIMLDEIKDDIIQQLKLIRMKIGQKGGTSEPVSGPDDPNWWEWLTRMFSEWLSDLLDIPEDKKGALDAAFDALKECFPFSIPWDLVTILGLLAHEPVVPVADLPLPVPEIVDASGMIEIHIDLTPYEGVATVIRAMTLIGFAVGLAKMSYEWFSTIKMGDM